MVKNDGYSPFPEKPVSKFLSDDKSVAVVVVYIYTYNQDRDFLSFHLIMHIHMYNT